MSALSEPQQRLLDQWLPGAELVARHGWGLTQTTVLEMLHDNRRLIVKAGGPGDRHIARELRAHRDWLLPWARLGVAPEIVHGDVTAKLLVTRWLSGHLVLGQPAAENPEAYRQAGDLLARFHAQALTSDPDYERQQDQRTLDWLESPHRIPVGWCEQVRSRLSTSPARPALLVPTHGDFQPRNWLVDSGVVRLIDFGCADLRPAYTDLTRLSYRDFARDPDLESAFIDGYGADPRRTGTWTRNRIREGVSTAAWSYQAGDEQFEQEGLRLLADALWSNSEEMD